MHSVNFCLFMALPDNHPSIMHVSSAFRLGFRRP